MDKIISLVLFSMLFSFTTITEKQSPTTFYRPDIGIYITYEKSEGKKKIPFKENWDFYFSLKNDSIAIIQDIRNKKVLEPKQFKVSQIIDSVFIKHYSGGKYRETEKTYYRKIIM